MYMINAEKSKEQLINELMALYRRIEDLEPLGRHYKQTEQARMEIEERYKRLISAITAYTYSMEVRDGVQ